MIIQRINLLIHFMRYYFLFHSLISGPCMNKNSSALHIDKYAFSKISPTFPVSCHTCMKHVTAFHILRAKSLVTVPGRS